MKYLIYVSSATQHFTEQDLKTLLVLSRENNQRAGITGLLLFSDGNFIQVIEGHPEKLIPYMKRFKPTPGIMAL